MKFSIFVKSLFKSADYGKFFNSSNNPNSISSLSDFLKITYFGQHF